MSPKLLRLFTDSELLKVLLVGKSKEFTKAVEAEVARRRPEIEFVDPNEYGLNWKDIENRWRY